MFYEVETSVTPADLGHRARQTRLALGRTVEDVAGQIGSASAEVELFEETGQGSVALLIAVTQAISHLEELDGVLRTPRFRSLAEVVAFERRRTDAR